jgi:hypothetical protein
VHRVDVCQYIDITSIRRDINCNVVSCNVRKLKALQMHQLQRLLQHSACGQHSRDWFDGAVCERWQQGRWFICQRVQVLVGGSVVALENSKGQNKGKAGKKAVALSPRVLVWQEHKKVVPSKSAHGSSPSRYVAEFSIF